MRFARLLLCLLIALCGPGNTDADAQKMQPLVTPVPERPAGQKDVLLLTVPKMKTVRVGFVGLGMRGISAVERWCHIDGTEIVALCDVEADRVEKAQKILEHNNLHHATTYGGDLDAYKKLCERKDIDLVYIATDWIHHVPIALYAMNHGKNVAIEVPAAISMQEIWDLINTSERTRKHCMMLENCVYDFFEMSALNMAQQGLFGDIIHVEGSYIHNLDEYWNEYWNNWRLDFNRKYRGDVYATHGMGPACQVANIHRGDRMDYLVAMDTKAINGPKHVKKMLGEDAPDFQNADQTTTMIRTVNGKTMLIQHNVMTPRPYNRMYQIVGTDGYASKYPVEELLFREVKIDPNRKKDYENLNAHQALPNELRNKMLKEYTPDFVKSIEATAKKIGGHGGMDYIMDYRLVYCLRNGLPLDMDVYDMAEWCCMGELTRLSLANNSAPVAIPDFTRGAWNKIQGFRYHFAK